MAPSALVCGPDFEPRIWAQPREKLITVSIESMISGPDFEPRFWAQKRARFSARYMNYYDAPKNGRDFEPRFWVQNRARFSARLCCDWRRDFAAIGGATSPQAEARRGENNGSHSCRSLRATARPSALHSAVPILRQNPELEVSRPGRRSSWSAAWQCGCTASASAAGDERTPARGMSVSDSRFRGIQTLWRCKRQHDAFVAVNLNQA